MPIVTLLKKFLYPMQIWLTVEEIHD